AMVQATTLRELDEPAGHGALDGPHAGGHDHEGLSPTRPDLGQPDPDRMKRLASPRVVASGAPQSTRGQSRTGRLAMDHVGIDLGKRASQIAILTEDGELINRRIWTGRPRLVEMFGRRPKARILVEASTESEWVARCLEGLGH